MRVVLYNFDNPDENSVEKRLSNGESLLERQVRMLKRLGVREVEIVGSKTLYEYGKKCITNRRDFKTMSLLPYRDFVSCSQDDMLLINSQLLFQQSVIEDMLAFTNQCRILAEFKETKKRQRLCVRLDMDRIVEVSDQIYGLDCAPIYPMVYISFKNFEEMKPLELEQAFHYENNQIFLSSFVKAVAKKTKDILLFEDIGMMKLVQRDEDYILNASMDENDKEQRIYMKESGSIVSIKEFLRKEGAEHVMVVHDDAFNAMPFKQLFALQDIVYETFCISDKNMESQEEELKALVSDKKIDVLIAVGGSNTLKVADMVRKDLFPEQKLYPELKLMAVPYFLSENYRILADYIILDDNIIFGEHELKESKDKETETKAISSPWKSLKKRIIKEIKKYKITQKIYTIIFKVGLFKLYQIIYPVNVKEVVFEAYQGNDQDGYSCNPRAIYEAMLSDSDYFDFKFIWAFNNPKEFETLKENKNTITIKRESRKYLKACAKAKYIFTNTGIPKYIRPNRNQVLIHTWHGKPMKCIGCSFKGQITGKRSKRQIFFDYKNMGKKLSVLLSPAPVFTPVMAEAFNLNEQRKGIILESGYPRNDYLFKYTEEDVLRIKMSLQIPLDKKVILYAPTWRPYEYIGSRKYQHTEAIDAEKLKEELGNEYVFLFRLHVLERGSIQFEHFPGILYDVSAVRDINELYIISDLLISDYSGTIFDFANLRRPIILFMHDLEVYLNAANGLNFDLDFLPGPIVKNQNELVEAIKYEMDNFVYEGKYKTFNETCNCLDGHECAIRTAKQIVKINPEITTKQRFYSKAKKIVYNISTIFRSFAYKIPIFFDENAGRIASYHNKYRGKRCFLIGNGPSLRLSDLNMLKNEYCFGCNLIYKIFERTDWRPTFLCASDSVVARTASKEFQKYSEIILWVNRNAYRLMKDKPSNLVCVNDLKREKYFVHGNMGEYYVPSKATVMTFMIELAMYMGFSEIYLLGVDFTIARSQNDHFINSYWNKEMIELERKKWKNKFRNENVDIREGQLRIEPRALYAYQKLAEYANKKQYKIYNATRGGNLEVFRRVDFDEIISNK